MTNLELLNILTNVRGEYILQAQELRSGQRKQQLHMMHRKQVFLIAAVVSLLLLLAGCAAFAWHWYTVYFTQIRQAPLSDSQIEYIEQNTQEYKLSQTYDGYTVELKSTISDSSSVYVTFGLSAPDDIDLSSVLDPVSEERLSFQGLFATTTGNDFPANISCDVAEDGDGKKNTLNVVLRIDPVVAQGETAPFGPGSICTIEFKGIVKWGYDREYEQELLSTKYAGQTDYILDPEESKLVHPQTLLVTGDWKFQIGLTLADMDTIELLSAPVSTNVFVIRIGASEYETVESVDKVTLTSVRLSPLGATISFEKPEPIEKFDCIYVNMDQFGDYSRAHECEGKNIVLVMKDGTEILFDQTDGAKNVAYLYADSPIALKEADYLLLSDGTKLAVHPQIEGSAATTSFKSGEDRMQTNGLNAGASSQTFADYFNHWLPGSVGSEAYSPDYQQKFVDLDEDSTDEMLIWNARTGVVYEVVTMVDGAPQCVYGGGTYGDDDHTVELYLCEGNILERDCGGSVQGKQLNEYYRMKDKQLPSVECVMEGNDGKFYWSESGGASSMMWKEISEAEYNAVRAKYVRIGVPQYPAPERIEEIQKSEENILLQVLENQEPFFSMSSGMSCTLSEYCSSEGDRMGLDVAITRYAFVDMDADGVQEVVVDFRFGENNQVMCIVLKYDSDNAVVQGTEFYYRQMCLLKEDGSFAYSGGADNDGWAKLRWDRLNSQWETIPVEDSSDKPDAQWYSYPITSDET